MDRTERWLRLCLRGLGELKRRYLIAYRQASIELTAKNWSLTQQLRECMADLEQCRAQLSAEKNKAEDGLSSVTSPHTAAAAFRRSAQAWLYRPRFALPPNISSIVSHRRRALLRHPG